MCNLKTVHAKVKHANVCGILVVTRVFGFEFSLRVHKGLMLTIHFWNCRSQRHCFKLAVTARESFTGKTNRQTQRAERKDKIWVQLKYCHESTRLDDRILRKSEGIGKVLAKACHSCGWFG